jgi:hypothetical protein
MRGVHQTRNGRDSLQRREASRVSEHEHHFIVVTQDWTHQERSFTLRYCEICGLTHRLVWYMCPSKWVWELIPEQEQDYFKAEQESEQS